MKCQVLIDWLTFSVKETEPQMVIREYLGMDPDLFQDAGYGLMGYQKVLRFSDICVCYEPRENDFFKSMGVCVSMSGNGCRTFESMSKLHGAHDMQDSDSTAFPSLFRLLTSAEDANISRVDIACDDRGGFLDMGTIISKIETAEINSRLLKRRVYRDYDGSSNTGSTVYIGAASSDFRVRIYDKAAEQGEDGHWVRVELVLRGQNSNAFVEQMTGAESVGKLAAQIINDKFSFIERDDSNITRCSVCQWWLDFVEELNSVRLVARCVIQHGIDRINDWVTNQVGPSLAILYQTLGWSSLFDIVQSARSRLSAKQQALISDYNNLQLSLA